MKKSIPMAKKAKLSDLITEELNKQDIVNMFKTDKDLEKRIKKIVSDVIADMYRVLWQHNSIFRTLGR